MGFVFQMQSSTLQDKLLIWSDDQETSNEIDQNNTDVMVTEEKISEVKVRYKQKWQKLEQQKSIDN